MDEQKLIKKLKEMYDTAEKGMKVAQRFEENRFHEYLETIIEAYV